MGASGGLVARDEQRGHLRAHQAVVTWADGRTHIGDCTMRRVLRPGPRAVVNTVTSAKPEQIDRRRLQRGCRCPSAGTWARLDVTQHGIFLDRNTSRV